MRLQSRYLKEQANFIKLVRLRPFMMKFHESDPLWWSSMKVTLHDEVPWKRPFMTKFHEIDPSWWSPMKATLHDEVPWIPFVERLWYVFVIFPIISVIVPQAILLFFQIFFRPSIFSKTMIWIYVSARIHLFKVSNINPKTKSEICSK